MDNTAGSISAGPRPASQTVHADTRLRYRSNIETTLGERLVFAGSKASQRIHGTQKLTHSPTRPTALMLIFTHYCFKFVTASATVGQH